jgi:D-alanine-D-alanine ligase-like ATP-grasp enzyme
MSERKREVPDLVRLGAARFEAGYWNGMRQASVLIPVTLSRSLIDSSALKQFDALTQLSFSKLPTKDMLEPAIAQHPVLGRLALFCLAVLNMLKMPTMSGVRSLEMQTPEGRVLVMGLPAFHEDVKAPQTAMKLAAQLMNQVSGSQQIKTDSLQASIQKITALFQANAPSGVNTLRFLQASHELGIPWRHLAANVYQFGWGARSRWMDSSFTDETSNIGARLARNKLSCLKVLRQAGLPAPRHRLVRSAEEAVVVAQDLGFPVVVKAAHLDGGRGVFAGLRSPAEVEKFYAKVVKLCPDVLVEEFIVGQDYRLQVFKGEVFWVVHRRPAKVVGDGVSSVQALLVRTNHERQVTQASNQPERATKPIVVDDEVQVWLQSQGLSMQSVPFEGEVVRLRGAANVSLGGSLQEVPLSSVHPDNSALAIDAAAVMRLDLAGIDLLVPDIGRSWRETGGGICEVNAQPQLSSHLPRFLLPKLVIARGRVPVVALIGLPESCSIRQTTVEAMRLHGMNLAWPELNGACASLLVNPHVNALVWPMQAMPMHSVSAPVDAVDLVVFFDSGRVPHRGSKPDRAVWPEWARNAKSNWRVSDVELPNDRAVTLDELPARLLSYFLEFAARRCDA